jgi:uncharacterized membrane protein YbhN (UPF0104 family)
VGNPSTDRPAAQKPPSSVKAAPSARGAFRRASRGLLIAVGVALIVFLLRAVGWPSIAANLARIGAGRFLFLVALYSFTQAAFALGWWLVVEPRPPLSRFPRLFAVYLGGDSLNYLAPGGVAGEPVKAALLGQSTRGGAALASLTVHKHADLLAQWAFVSAGVLYAVTRFSMPLAARAASIVGAAGLGGLLLLLTWAMRRGTYGPILRRLARWKPLGDRLERYHRSAAMIDARIRSFSRTHRERYAAAVALCFLGWCGGWLETWLLLRFLSSPSASWGTALAVESLAMALNNMLLFIPGRVGGAEGVRVAVFVLLGMPPAQGLAYGLVRRGRELLWAIPGLVFLIREHALGIVRAGAGDLPVPSAEGSPP